MLLFGYATVLGASQSTGSRHFDPRPETTIFGTSARNFHTGEE